MCLRPIWIPVPGYPTGVYVKCKACPWCKGNRVNDWAGRCVAEQQFSTAVVAITLTYAKTIPGAGLDEHYRDVQLMLKRLRKDRYKVRYVVAGEYGERKGRVHWHAILFFRGAVPPVEYGTKFYNWKYWPHGYAFLQSPDFEGMTYVLKYTLKDDSAQANEAKRLHMSKYPPIGAEFFQSLAADFVKARLPVHSPEYAFADLRFGGGPQRGRLRKFWLSDRSREIFLGGSDRYGLKGYVQMWRDAYGEEPPKTEFLTEQYDDPRAAAEVEAAYWAAPAADDVGYLLLPAPTLGLVVRRSETTATYVPHEKENPSWHLDIGDGSSSAVRSVGGRLKRAGLPSDLIACVLRWLTQSRPVLTRQSI